MNRQTPKALATFSLGLLQPQARLTNGLVGKINPADQIVASNMVLPKSGHHPLTTIALLLLVTFTPSQLVSASSLDDLQGSFKNPPDNARLMMRWWWFGPAVTKAEIERELRLMKEGGIGGFEVQPVYPLVLDDEAAGIKTLPFLSDEFNEALRFTAEKANELGLRFDLTLGSGWPFGGPSVSIEHAAARLRYEHVKIDPVARSAKVPSIGAGEKLLAVFLASVEGSSFAANSTRELTAIKDGIVDLPERPAGNYEILFFISSRTGMQVKRPAVGAEGFVLDHMNRAATDHYLKTVGERLLQASPSRPPYAIFCDSLEVYNSNWSSDYLEEFQKRRGYDLKPHLPALVNKMGPETKALRRDWGLTLTELLNERFLAPLQAWAKQHRTLLRVQDYGVPAAALSSNAFADLSEGEGAQWKTLSSTRWASSASHIYSQPVTSSETWTWLHSPSFRATPLDVKAEADRHFLEGINQLIGHGWPYTAPGIQYPGWRFYAAGVFNEKNPWWIVMPDVARYLQRVSFMMRQGQPANDVAIYLPNDDARANSVTENVNLREVLVQRLGPDLIPKLIEAGYGFDFFDDDSLKQKGKIENGSLVLGQNRYKAVILPGVESISPEIYKQLEDFARGGGIVVATRTKPVAAPGFKATQASHDQVKSISQRLFEESNAPGHFVADEDAELARDLPHWLTPDVAWSSPARDVGFIHRRTSEADVYFIANTSNTRQELTAKFAINGSRAEWWDPLTGSITEAELENAGKGAAMKLALEPYGSRLLIFPKRAKAATRGDNATKLPVVVGIVTTIDLSSGWSVTFGERASAVNYDRLHSWTDEEGTRYFSGAATYQRSIDLPAEILRGNRRMRLDFGEGQAVPEQTLRSGMQAWFDSPVREAAVVYINEQPAGSVWCPPYSLDVSSLLRPGENKIRIVVANTALNYMAGHSLPDYRLLNLRYGERFQAQDMDKVQPITSGLLGPIRLVAQ